MENRRKINRPREESNQLKIYKDVYEICNETLCAKTDEGFHLKRTKNGLHLSNTRCETLMFRKAL
jgi:hypothetical protein